MKYITKLGVMLSAGFMLAAASCTDYSDYNTVPVADDPNQPGANNTLWENIANDQQLTKFAALVRQSNYSEALSSSRFYTIWAPVDNAIDDVEYNRLMASDSATIVKQFMQQHMTEYNYPVSGALDSTTIVSLNLKHHPFTQASFDGFSYVDVNISSTNGVLHKIDGFSKFYDNLYESIDNLTGCDSIKNYIQKYDVYSLDLNASVIGPLVNGKQTYLDSVMVKHNSVISSIMRAELENEDSTYCMLIPNDEAWEAAYTAINPYYNYIPKLDYMDITKKTTVASSTTPTTAKAITAAVSDDNRQDSLTCSNIVGNFVFSNWYQPNQPLFGNGSVSANDSALSTRGRFLTTMQEVLDHTIETSEQSNGMTRVIDVFPFRSWETYNPPIVVSSPNRQGSLNVPRLTTHNIALDSLVGRDSLFSKVPKMFHQWILPETSRFFSYVAIDSVDIGSTTAKPEFSFALPDVRSAKYHIYVITVPAQVEKPQAPVRPYHLCFYLSWTDANNKQQYSILPYGAKSKTVFSTDKGTNTTTSFYLDDPGRVNVIDLGEFEFPVCYDGLDAYPSLMMMNDKSFGAPVNLTRYDRDLRVAGVYLIPVEYNDYWANSDNE